MITRVLAYAALAALLLGLTWGHGYITAENHRLQQAADNALAQVNVVIKTVVRERMIENASLKNLQDDYNMLYAEYLVLHDDAKRNHSLSDAASKLRTCPPAGTPGDELPDARRMLADVEGFVLVLLEQGDREIAKLRRLYERDSSLARVKPH